MSGRPESHIFINRKQAYYCLLKNREISRVYWEARRKDENRESPGKTGRVGRSVLGQVFKATYLIASECAQF